MISLITQCSGRRFAAVFLALVLIGPAVAQPPRSGFRGGSRAEAPAERIEPEDLPWEYGVATIPDHETFAKLSYQGTEVMRDAYLADLEFVKFIIVQSQTSDAKVYFMNTENYRAHPPYMQMVGLGGFRRGGGGGGGPGSTVRGALTYLPRLEAPSGDSGLYIFDFQPNDVYSFDEITSFHDTLVRYMPVLKGRVAFHPFRANVGLYEQERDKYEAAGLAVHLDSDNYAKISYLPLNLAEAYGRLRILGNDTRPSPRDIVICQTLPNQLPRVAGVISEERQTPLSHVNLRAIQDKAPNAYIKNALEVESIHSLLGKWVHYQVTPRGYTLREAAESDVDAFFAALRPASTQYPERDLSVTTIKPLNQVKFGHSRAFGVKAANLATLLSFGFPEGTIPDGFAIPFHFYHEFMTHNDLYQRVNSLIREERFQRDRDYRSSQLESFRAAVEKAPMPDWMMTELGKVQSAFPEGIGIRCRSSTNNEDLPGFSGAGLYDSFTHRSEEGPLSNSIKQVYASLWNFRAFEEREFYRIDHQQAAMGVLLHPNFEGERANGVAVTDDILYETSGNYYLNTQIGEDLVTNPKASASPEEVLLGWWERDGYERVRRSTAVPKDQWLISENHLAQMRDYLATLHARFRDLYGYGRDDTFAMEIEYKITSDGRLVIKQARPWVF